MSCKSNLERPKSKPSGRYIINMFFGKISDPIIHLLSSLVKLLYHGTVIAVILSIHFSTLFNPDPQAVILSMSFFTFHPPRPVADPPVTPSLATLRSAPFARWARACGI